MPVMADDIKSYGEFVQEQILALNAVQYEPDTIVWHYTSGKGLLGIIESGTIHATQVAALNDSTEIRYAVGLFREALNKLLEKNQDEAEARVFLTKVLETYSDDDPRTPSHAPSRFFVACFSSLEDDLNQWRAYGEHGGENNYAIGFRASQLQDPQGAVLRVNYDMGQHKAVAQRAAEATLEFFRQGIKDQRDKTVDEWTNAFLPAWDEKIGYLSPLVKDNCFASESEFRLVHELHVREFGNLEFVQKENVLARYLPISFPSYMAVKYPMLPIAKIIVGPAKHQHISRISIRALLVKMGYGETAPVEISKRPLQR